MLRRRSRAAAAGLSVLLLLCCLLCLGSGARASKRRSSTPIIRGVVSRTSSSSSSSSNVATKPRRRRRALKSKEREEDDSDYNDEDDEDDDEEKDTTPSPSPSPGGSFRVNDSPPPAMMDDPSERTEGDENGEFASTQKQKQQQKIENSCRAASRGEPTKTNNRFTVTYEYQLVVTSTSLNDDALITTGLVVDQAVQDYLTNEYILKYCSSSSNNEGGREGGPEKLRQLQDETTTTFAAGDVRGIKRSDTPPVILEDPCDDAVVVADDGGGGGCVRLQGSNDVFLDEDYDNADDSNNKQAMLDVVAAGFASGEITSTAQRSDSGIVQADYVQGSLVDSDGATSVQGDTNTRDNGSTSANNSSSGNGGMRPAGKVFLSFFIIILFALFCFVGYKYGKPKFDQARKENRSRRIFRPRKKRAVPLEDSSSQLRKQHRKNGASLEDIVIAETMDSCSINSGSGGGGGAGTEMILADLQDVSSESPIEFQAPTKDKDKNLKSFTPSTLPDIEERSRPPNESNVDWSYSFNDVSFSDIQVVVDDEDSVNDSRASQQRSYASPDTVDL